MYTERVLNDFLQTAMRNLLLSLVLVGICIAGIGQTIFEGEDGLFYDSLENLYSGKYTEFYADGVIKAEYTLSYGEKDGLTKLYHPNGILSEIRAYKEGLKHGAWSSFNTDGVKTGEANYAKDTKNGKWYVWDEKGTLRADMTYIDGRKVGVWYIYDSTGNLEKEKDFNGIK